MHGLIGKMRAAPGRRDELIVVPGEGPGCLACIVAKDVAKDIEE